MYVIGKTGTGKSTLLETLALQDIINGRGMMLIDPHGDLAERVVRAVPAHRRSDVIYFNVPDPTQPFEYWVRDAVWYALLKIKRTIDVSIG
jgi:predicted ATPase